VRNVVNGEPYVVRMEVPECPFKLGIMVFGALTPWRGEWYWSGEQKGFDNVPEAHEASMRRDMLRNSSQIAYRYCRAEVELARESIHTQHGRFLAHYQRDLVVFPDGLTMAAAEQKRMEAEWALASPEQAAGVMERRGSSRPHPPMTFPPAILNHTEGIGIFFNPEEGVELLTGFNCHLSGLQKKGANLTETEMQALWHLITDSTISPAFVKRLVAEHGAESIAETFLLRAHPPDQVLAVLLHCHKGHFYRTRYPTLALADVDGPEESQPEAVTVQDQRP